MHARRVPERRCVACRTQRPKRAMVRIVRLLDGRVAVDPTGKASGRGSYLCRRTSCWKAGLRKETLARALKTTISASDRASLEQFATELPEDEVEEQQSGVAEGSIH